MEKDLVVGGTARRLHHAAVRTTTATAEECEVGVNRKTSISSVMAMSGRDQVQLGLWQ